MSKGSTILKGQVYHSNVNSPYCPGEWLHCHSFSYSGIRLSDDLTLDGLYLLGRKFQSPVGGLDLLYS